MIELSVIRDLVAIFGVIAGFSYYVLTVRNAQKERQMGMLMQLYQTKHSPEGIYRMWRIMVLTWDDFDDYLEKWGPYDHPEVTEELKLITSSWSFYDGLGKILKEGMVDLDTVYEMLGLRILMVWFKYETIIKSLRNFEEGNPGSDYLSNFEYLANVMIKVRKMRGQSLPLSWLHHTSTLRQELA